MKKYFIYGFVAVLIFASFANNSIISAAVAPGGAGKDAATGSNAKCQINKGGKIEDVYDCTKSPGKINVTVNGAIVTKNNLCGKPCSVTVAGKTITSTCESPAKCKAKTFEDQDGKTKKVEDPAGKKEEADKAK